jgi:cell division protein FtsZ
MPFTFEGKRRRKQAEEALAAIEREADAVICFENDKMGEAVPPQAGIHQAFASADLTVSQSVRAIASLFKRPGLIHIGFDDLRVALQNHGARSVFGFGEAEGDNRANESLARALKNSLMDRGRMLGEARSVLVNICGGPEMTLNEVQILMEELGKHISDDAQIRFGASVDRAMGSRMSVTIISSVAGEAAPVAVPQPVAELKPVARPRRAPRVEPSTAPKIEALEEADEEPVADLPVEKKQVAAEETFFATTPETKEPAVAKKAPHVEQPIPRPTLPTFTTRPSKFAPEPPAIPVAAPAKAPQEKQEVLQFEPVTRGRFEKSEPTIVDGQDLDVPTFLRRNVKVK